MFRRLCLCLLFFCLSTSLFSQATTQNTSALSIRKIMQGEQFTGYLPEDISWSEDNRTIYFLWNPEADTVRSMYKVRVDEDGTTGSPEKVSLEERRFMPGRPVYNKDRTRKLYSKNGDLFLVDLETGKRLQITHTLESERNPFFSGDETQVVFEKNDNLFTWNIESGVITQLSDFRKGNEKKDASKSAQDEWLERDQLELFDILAERKATRETRKYRSKQLEPKRPKTYYLGSKQLSGLSISPDLRFIVFRLTEEGDGTRTDVPSYVTESGKVESLVSRPKVGAPVDATELGVYDRKQDSIFIADHLKIAGIFDKPGFLKEYWPDTLPYEDQYKQPRPVVFHGPLFSEDGKALVEAKSMDNKDRWLLLLDPEKGKLKLLDRQHDDAWIGGPGISGWNFAMGDMGWMPDNRHIWFHSEETGFSHLYRMDVETGEKKALTQGDFEILDVKHSRDKQYFYITSNKETPFEHHFYRMSVEGGPMEKITSLPGNHEAVLSPNEKWLAIRYSYSNKPWELYLMPNKPGATMQQLTYSTTDAFNEYPWREPELVWFTASDGVDVPARLYRPAAGDRNGAAVIFVHGAGYLQNVHRWWSSYYREYMFHNMLADNGFTVLDIDYRGSRGYGRDWRTAIYRHMGGKDLSDQVDGARYLVESHGMDADRIGIYGGSYGGFITLMALFTSPGTFKCGAALRSVTDWAHYNHPYTSNILNTPDEDSLAYRRSSPIYHAEGLEDHLLILHGMIDVNVQFQDVVRLAQRLIELEKENWEFAVFPVEDHGFVEPSSWADEYRRIFNLFRETLGSSE